MTAIIIYDPEAKIAALVDPDLPAALGPIAVEDGEGDPRDVLNTFLQAYEDDPSEVPTWTLFHAWFEFINVFVDLAAKAADVAADGELTEDEALQAVVDEVVGGYGDDEEPPGFEPPHADAPEVDPPPAGPDVDHAADRELEEELADEEELDVDETELASRLANVPGGTPAQRGEKECWLCHGETTIDGPPGKVTCSTCLGVGRLTLDDKPLTTVGGASA